MSSNNLIINTIKSGGMEGRLTNDYIRLLELVMFDRELFRKEFNKTKGWVSNTEMEIIQTWFMKNYGNDMNDIVSG